MWRQAWKREVYVLHSLTRKPIGIYNSIKKIGCLILCAVYLHLCVYCCSKRWFTSNTPPQLRRVNHPVSHSINVTSFTTHTSTQHHSHSDWDRRRHPDCTFAHVRNSRAWQSGHRMQKHGTKSQLHSVSPATDGFSKVGSYLHRNVKQVLYITIIEQHLQNSLKVKFCGDENHQSS